MYTYTYIYIICKYISYIYIYITCAMTSRAHDSFAINPDTALLCTNCRTLSDAAACARPCVRLNFKIKSIISCGSLLLNASFRGNCSAVSSSSLPSRPPPPPPPPPIPYPLTLRPLTIAPRSVRPSIRASMALGADQLEDSG